MKVMQSFQRWSCVNSNQLPFTDVAESSDERVDYEDPGRHCSQRVSNSGGYSVVPKMFVGQQSGQVHT